MKDILKTEITQPNNFTFLLMGVKLGTSRKRRLQVVLRTGS